LWYVGEVILEWGVEDGDDADEQGKDEVHFEAELEEGPAGS
jgi:hypothetical protein